MTDLKEIKLKTWNWLSIGIPDENGEWRGLPIQALNQEFAEIVINILNNRFVKKSVFVEY